MKARKTEKERTKRERDIDTLNKIRLNLEHISRVKVAENRGSGGATRNMESKHYWENKNEMGERDHGERQVTMHVNSNKATDTVKHERKL